MARSRRKSRRRSFSSKRARRRSGRSGAGVSVMGTIVPAMIYGAGRKYLSNAAQPITSMIPLGDYADEALFGLGGYFLAKKGKGIVRDIGKAMVIVEAASVGNQLLGNLGAPAGGNNETIYG